MGSSAKGNEYFLKYLLGTHSNVLGRRARRRGPRPRDVDLARRASRRASSTCCVSADFRMTSTHPAVRRRASRRPPGTRSTTCPPPTCTRSSTRSPRRSTRRGRPRATSTPSTPIARELSRAGRAPTSAPARTWSACPMQHDTPGETAQPGGVVRDWGAATCRPIPGKTMPALQVVERDYTAIADKLGARRSAGREARLHRQERHLRRRRTR